MPILADLCRADLLLYCAATQPNTAVVVAEAKPHSVLPLYPETLQGHQVGRKTHPAVFHVLSPRRLAPGAGGVVVRSELVVQELVPVRSPDGRTIAVLSIETNTHELKRLQRKNPVFRKALLRLRQMVLHGSLYGCGNLTPMGEHDGPFVVDGQGCIRYISGIAENLYRKLGYTENLIGKSLADLNTHEEVVFRAMAECQCLEEEVSEQGQVWIKKAIPLLDEESSWLPGRGSGRQSCSGAIVVIHDITEQRQKEQALKIKSTLIKEIHHRVKNNLQTIAALLRMQARRSKSAEVRQSLQEGVSRILSIAVVHEFL